MREKDAIAYEIAGCSFFMSCIYRLFPMMPIKKAMRKFKRYQEFKQMEKEMYDRTGKYLTKYFTK